MKRACRFAVLLACSVFASANAANNDFAAIGNLDFGFKDLELDPPGQDAPFNAFFVTINPSVSLIYGDAYFSMSYDKTIDSDGETLLQDEPPTPSRRPSIFPAPMWS